MEAEAARASSHISGKRWLPEAAKCLESVCCANDCTLQAFISQIAHKAAKSSNCDSTSNGKMLDLHYQIMAWVFYMTTPCFSTKKLMERVPTLQLSLSWQLLSPISQWHKVRREQGCKYKGSRSSLSSQSHSQSSLKWPSQRQ